MTDVVVTAGAIRCAKSQSDYHHQTNAELFTGRMPFLSPSQQYQSTEGLHGFGCCGLLMHVVHTHASVTKYRRQLEGNRRSLALRHRLPPTGSRL